MTYDHIDRKLLAALRKDSSMRLLTYSMQTGIPKSTVHQRLRKLQGTGIRCTPLLDWRLLGQPLTVCFYTAYMESIIEHPCVNTALRVSPDVLYIECIFPTIKAMEEFKESLRVAKSYPVVEVLKQEGFIPKEDEKEKDLQKASVLQKQRHHEERDEAHELDEDVD